MPKFLIVSATKFEIQPLADRFKISIQGEEGLFSSETLPDVSVLVTGVGMVNTAFYLGKYSEAKFDYIINAGVCGAINRDLKQGEIVNVISDTISELGAEDGEEFIKYPDLNLGGTNVYENPSRISHEGFNQLKKVHGITVNKVHGSEKSITKMKQLYAADIESMEGAAFFRGCKDVTANYFQVRAVSNYVERRDKSKWQMKDAIKNLNEFLIELIEDLDKKN